MKFKVTHKNWISILSTSLFFLLILMQPIHQIGHLFDHHSHHCHTDHSSQEKFQNSENHCEACEFQFAQPLEITFDVFEFNDFTTNIQLPSIGEIKSKISTYKIDSNFLRGPPKIA